MLRRVLIVPVSVLLTRVLVLASLSSGFRCVRRALVRRELTRTQRNESWISRAVHALEVACFFLVRSTCTAQCMGAWHGPEEERRGLRKPSWL